MAHGVCLIVDSRLGEGGALLIIVASRVVDMGRGCPISQSILWSYAIFSIIMYSL